MQPGILAQTLDQGQQRKGKRDAELRNTQLFRQIDWFARSFGAVGVTAELLTSGMSGEQLQPCSTECWPTDCMAACSIDDELIILTAAGPARQFINLSAVGPLPLVPLVGTYLHTYSGCAVFYVHR
jgi:hypothetical protein